jgi:nitrogen fixation NifU-like protein
VYDAELRALAARGGERLGNAATGSASRANPLCGDEIDVELAIVDGTVVKIAPVSRGCAVLRASATLLDRTVGLEARAARAEADRTIDAIGQGRFDGALAALSPVRMFPMRRRCATLPWEALSAALGQAKT